MKPAPIFAARLTEKVCRKQANSSLQQPVFTKQIDQASS
jgi:hypothetical protein